MSVQPATPAGVLERRAILFTPGPRLGWVFRDRHQLAAPFPEPPPDLETMRAAATERARFTRVTYRKARNWLGLPSAGLLVLLLLANGCTAAITGTRASAAVGIFELIICGPGIAIATVMWHRSQRAAAALNGVTGTYQQ